MIERGPIVWVAASIRQRPIQPRVPHGDAAPVALAALLAHEFDGQAGLAQRRIPVAPVDGDVEAQAAAWYR